MSRVPRQRQTTVTPAVVPAERITQSIYAIRGQRVMLSAVLARLYGVEPRALIQAVKRNIERFPGDFMFHLTKQEFDNLKSQSVTSRSWGGVRTPPYAFTEHGVAMLSAVLRSGRAVQVSILIIRAFVRLRQMLAGHAELARKMEELERRSIDHDDKIQALRDVIHELMANEDEFEKGRIGYDAEGA